MLGIVILTISRETNSVLFWFTFMAFECRIQSFRIRNGGKLDWSCWSLDSGGSLNKLAKVSMKNLRWEIVIS